MTWTAVGAINPNGATGSFSLTPSATGDLIIVWVGQFSNATVTATALSSSNVTWSFVASVLGTNAPNMTMAMFIGTVTGTGAATVSITWSGTAPANIFISGHEFASSLGAWTVDNSATLNVGGGSSWPNIAASAAGDLYAGYALNGGSASQGTTSGYTFLLDSGSNGMAYNLSCSSGTVIGPTWADAGEVCGVMALIKETGGGGGGGATPAPPPPQPGGQAWQRQFRRRQVRATFPTTTPAPVPYITGLAGSGTAGYFQDLNSTPRLLLMDMAWGLPGNAGRWNGGSWQSDMDAYFTARASQGYTAWWGVPWINHQIDSTTSFTDGRTWDGVYPFQVNGTPGTITSSGQTVTLNDPFWQRTDYMINSARRNGITILLNLGMEYDFQASWIWGSGVSSAQLTTIGGLLAGRYPQASFPNLQWVFGDDDVNDDFGPKFGALLTGIRNAGDTRNAVTMEQTTNTNCHIRFDTGAVYASGGFGMTSAQWNFVYSYVPTYSAVEDSYTESGTTLIPVGYGDGVWYGDTDNSTPDFTIRRFCWWALASGARAIHCTDGPSAAGSTMWTWQSGALAGLTSDPNGPWVTSHIGNVRAFLESLTDWYKLVPDKASAFITSGRGTRATAGAPQNFTVNYGDSDNYVAGSVTPAGTLAIIYSAAHFSITIDQTKMMPGYTAYWVDPLSLATTAATAGSSYNSTGLGNNSAGNPDWVLVLQAPPPSPPQVTPAVPQPGSQLYRRFFYRSQQPQSAGVTGAPVLNVTAGLATGTGTAPGPGIADQGGSVTSTGSAQGPGTELTPGLAAGTGTAQGPGTELTPVLAAGTGSAPGPGIADQGGSVSSTGAAQGPGTELTPALATGTGAGQSPQAVLTSAAGLASATGTAQDVADGLGTELTPGLATGTGTALAPLPLLQVPYGVPQPGSQQYRRFFYRSQQPQAVSIAGAAFLNVTAGLATATGTAVGPSLENDTTTGFSAASGSAGSPGADLTPPLGAGTGTALGPGIQDQGGSVTSAGSAQAAGTELTPALAGATGSPLTPGITGQGGSVTSTGAAGSAGAELTPALSGAVGTAVAPSAAYVVAVGLATATGSSPAAGPVVTAGMASGSGSAGAAGSQLSALATASGSALGLFSAVVVNITLANAAGTALNAVAQLNAAVVKGFSTGTSVTESAGTVATVTELAGSVSTVS